ncbi:MAG: NAD(P)H-dependent oxidoreductase subunit E [Deltaproteobacteria bacterium]|nr:NAD(P)H-dependent oxidoreductase subunit E [Deltaproteobacteria bacterium]
MNETNPIANDSTEAIDYLALDRLVEDRFNNDKENLIMILQAIQAQYNYLPRPALSYLSEKIEIPLSRIYGVATFYSTFSLEPRGKNIISICLGTACHVRGAGKVLDRIEDTLHVRNGETTEDGQFTLESVRCIGCCSLGPVVKINEDVYGRIASEDLTQILDHYGESKIETGGE